MIATADVKGFLMQLQRTCDYLGSLVVQNSSVSQKEDDISHEQSVKILMVAFEKAQT